MLKAINLILFTNNKVMTTKSFSAIVLNIPLIYIVKKMNDILDLYKMPVSIFFFSFLYLSMTS